MRSTRGFTLVEMLVTLVVGGLVITLLWQALGQMAQLELRLADSRVLSDRDALRRAWVTQALSGVMTGPQESELRFRGDAGRLQALTTMPPWPGSSGPEWMVLELRPVAGSATEVAQTQLDSSRHVPASGGGAGALVPHGRSAVLWSWKGAGRFDYLDRAGSWQVQWPPATGTGGPLPEAIRLQGLPGGTLVVPVVARQSPLIGRGGVLQSDDLR